MRRTASPLSPHQWITDLFSSRAAAKGEVIRRSRRDIERYVGLQAFLDELDRKGFHAVENAGQIVVFCNQEPIRRIR